MKDCVDCVNKKWVLKDDRKTPVMKCPLKSIEVVVKYSKALAESCDSYKKEK